MKKIIVLFDKPTSLSLPYKNAFDVPQNLHINPGKNTVDADAWGRVAEHHKELLKKYPELTVQEDVKTPDAINIAEVKPYQNATAIVSNTFEVSELESFLSQENGREPKSRAAVVEAIETQIKLIKAEDE